MGQDMVIEHPLGNTYEVEVKSKLECKDHTYHGQAVVFSAAAQNCTGVDQYNQGTTIPLMYKPDCRFINPLYISRLQLYLIPETM